MKIQMDCIHWTFLIGLFSISCGQSVTSSFENKTGQNDKSRIFSPRMDYDEWTPLGRGDPLKNDPTFDYVPPVLDRVQYWIDSHTTEPSAKRDILVLGVTAKKTSPKILEQFLKFVDGPKFYPNQESNGNAYRSEFTGSTGAEPPKFIRTTNFRNGALDYRNQNRIQPLPASYYPSPFYNQKAKPYTMMLPPPIQNTIPSMDHPNFNSKDKVYGDIQYNTQTEEGPIGQQESYVPVKNYQRYTSKPQQRQQPNSKSPKKNGVVVSQIETIKSVYAPTIDAKEVYEGTTPSISFKKSNLIYQSTQTLANNDHWFGSKPTTSPISTAAFYNPADHFEDHHVSASTNHEVVVGQNANIIVDGDTNENEEVVVGQKNISSAEKSREPSLVESEVRDSSKKMHIVMANSPSSLSDGFERQTEGPVTVVMPMRFERNSTRSESASKTLTPVSSITPNFASEPSPSRVETPTKMISSTRQTGMRNPNPQIFGSFSQPFMVHQPSRPSPHHGAMQHYPRPSFRPQGPMHLPPPQSMMGPPLLEAPRPVPLPNPTSFQTLEPKVPETTTSSSSSSSSSTTPTITTGASFPPQTRTPPETKSPLATILREETTTSNASYFDEDSKFTERTTTVPNLTTDPIFSHYKQPDKPISGPMYLIIQGHSKVKTYKPTINKHGVPIESNEIEHTTEKRPLSQFEKLINENTKGGKSVIDDKKKDDERTKEKENKLVGQESLLSLVESGFSAFTVPPPPATEEEQQTNSVTTVQVNPN